MSSAVGGDTELKRSISSNSQDAAIARFDGHVDKASLDGIDGWAFDRINPDRPVLLELLLDNRILAVFEANEYRPDLAAAGFGNGRHGLSLRLPSAFFSNYRNVFRIRRQVDGVDLPGSPFIIENEDLIGERDLARILEQSVVSRIAGAQEAKDLDRLTHILLSQFDLVLDARAALERSAKLHLESLQNQFRGREDFGEIMAGLLHILSTKYPALDVPTSETPVVSVVIPVFNKFEFTYRCLDSIIRFAPSTPFEIIVVDDCSRDETMFAAMLTGKTVRIVRNDHNLGFVASCNAGAMAARGRYLFFLNNDTEVTAGWLDELVASFGYDSRIGIVGSKLLGSDGKLQEAGGIIWRLGDGWNWGRGENPEDPLFCFLRDADYVSGAALMIPKDLFESCGAFGEEFKPAYYEDTDLCFKVRAAERRVVVQPHSKIVHFEGVTAGTDVNGQGMKRYQLVNHRKFYEKWRQVLAGHRLNGDQPRREAERQVTKTALFIDETVPTPDQDAGSNAAVQHMLSLQRLGYKVHFVGADNMAKISPYTDALEKRGVECYYAPHYWSVEEIFRRSGVRFDVVYLHRLSNAWKYLPMVRQQLRDATVVYSVADLHYLRLERQFALERTPELAITCPEVKAREISAITASDSTIVHSTHEAEVLGRETPEARVFVVPWTVPIATAQAPFALRKGVAFIGGFGHAPNVDAATWLVQEIMPLVWKTHSHITCYLVGSNMPESLKGMASDRIIALGFVPTLDVVFERVRLTVAPLRYGAGLKGKVLSSLAAGIPCIPSQCAAEGMNLPERLDALISKTSREFAERILILHNDEAANKRYADIGSRFVAENFSADVVDRRLKEALVTTDRDQPSLI